MSNGNGNCRRVNVNYEIECMREGCDFVYRGETCRNAFCRGREHLRGLDNRSDDSVLVEHIRDYHECDFSNTPVGLFVLSLRCNCKLYIMSDNNVIYVSSY